MRRERNNINCNCNNIFSRGRLNSAMPYPPSSPTSSSASSSSPGRSSCPLSPFSGPNPRPRTTGEVSRPSPTSHDASSYLPSQTHPPVPSQSQFVCLDLLSRPLAKDTPPTVPGNGGPTLFGTPLMQRPPITVLSLNPGGGHRSPSPSPPAPVVSNTPMQTSPKEASPSPLPSSKDIDREDRAARKKQRMMNNRESAARSRARRQAFTQQLQLEIRKLLEENERLKREHGEMCLAAATSVPKKFKYRRRCSSAPL